MAVQLKPVPLGPRAKVRLQQRYFNYKRHVLSQILTGAMIVTCMFIIMFFTAVIVKGGL